MNASTFTFPRYSNAFNQPPLVQSDHLSCWYFQIKYLRGMPEEEDTDTKLAILASLLEPASYPLEDLLDALQSSNGDVGQAAEAILLPRVKSAGKRKAGSSLESWLGKKRVPVSPSWSSETATSMKANSNAIKKEGVNLLDHLKHPTTERTKSIPRPAVHLTSQSSIDAHNLPLSILKSPLSPSFASALYLAMMEESTTWERNRFYLAGKWVESPHTVCHYSRDPAATGTTEAVEKGEEVLEGKEGKKATYMWSGQEIAASRVSLPRPEADRRGAQVSIPIPKRLSPQMKKELMIALPSTPEGSSRID
jgi:hypothetical protein